MALDWRRAARRRRPRGCSWPTCPTTWPRPLVLDVLDDVPAVERMLVMVQKEAGERLAAGPGDEAYGIPSVKVAYHGHAEVVGTVPPERVPPEAPGRVGARRRSPATPAARPSTPTPSGSSPSSGPASASAARCCAARSPASSTPRRSIAAAGVDPQARAEDLALAQWAAAGPPVAAKLLGWLRGRDGAGAGEGDALVAGHRGAGRRLPPDRRRDGHGRPRRRARHRRRRRRAGGHRRRRARPAGARRRHQPRPPGARARRADRRRPPDQAHPRRRRARRRLGRRRRRPALGGLRRRSTAPPRSAPTCRSASSAAGPGSPASASASTRCRTSSAPSRCSPRRFGCSTPAVYRAWDDLGGPTAEGPNDLEPAALAVEPRLAEWRDRLGDATGATPVLAGSGSTWFVDGAFPDVAGAVVVRAVPAGWGQA